MIHSLGEPSAFDSQALDSSSE